MFPSELFILMSMALPSTSSITFFKRQMNAMNEYVDSLYSSLVQRGYLNIIGSDSYELTYLGEETLVQFLDENTAKADALIRSLQQLGIDSNQKIKELGSELIRANK